MHALLATFALCGAQINETYCTLRIEGEERFHALAYAAPSGGEYVLGVLFEEESLFGAAPLFLSPRVRQDYPVEGGYGHAAVLALCAPEVYGGAAPPLERDRFQVVWLPGPNTYAVNFRTLASLEEVIEGLRTLQASFQAAELCYWPR